MPITRQDLDAVAPRVLARLREMVDLPAHGTVAGQAVASLAWEALGLPMRGPVRDVDVFVSAGLPRSQRGLAEWPDGNPAAGGKGARASARVRQDGPGMTSEYNHYEHVKFIARRGGVSILRTYQAGLVNYTLLDHPSIEIGGHGHDTAVSQQLVDGFDLNAVGVGIHLASGTLVASDAFVTFLNHPQVAVQAFNTPAHTLIRLARKVLGGELAGVGCDFGLQRDMLELAILCQRSRREGLGAVLRFGERFKALQEAWAHVLPAVASQEVEAPAADAPAYLLHRFEPELPTNPASLALLRGLSPSGDGQPDETGENNADFLALPWCVLGDAYMMQFGRLYALYHPARMGLDEAQAAAGRQALESIRTLGNDGEKVQRFCRAMGNPLHVVRLPGMDEDDATAFFFGQAAGKSARGEAAAVAAWEGLGEARQRVVAGLSLRADEVVALDQAHERGWKALLARQGGRVLSQAGHVAAETGDEGARFVRQLLDWTLELGEAGQRALREVVPCWSGGDVQPMLGGVLDGLPAHERPAMAQRLVEAVLPGWPAGGGEPPPVRHLAAKSWLMAGLALPQAYWDAHRQEDTAGFVERIVEGISDRLPGPGQDWPDWNEGSMDKVRRRVARREEALDRALPGLDGRAAGAHHARVLRALLSIGQEDRVVALVAQARDDAAWRQALGRLIAYLAHPNPVKLTASPEGEARERMSWECRGLGAGLLPRLRALALDVALGEEKGPEPAGGRRPRM